MTTAIKKLKKAAESSKRFIKLEVSPNSKVLWVVFSHVDIPPDKFAQTGVFRHLDGSKLFLNCPDNAWYSRGVPGFSHDISSTVMRLADLVRPFNTCFVGHSMGAYLSLICGNIIPGSRFIATSPEFHLNLTGSRASRNGVTVPGEWGDISQLRHRFHDHPNGQIYMGAYDPIDAFFLAHLNDIEGMGDVFEVPHHHGVTEFFTSNGIYLDILGGDKSKLYEFEVRGFLNRAGSFGSPEQYEMFYELFRLQQTNASPHETDSILSYHTEWSNSGWQETRAKLFGKYLKVDEALVAAQRAYLCQMNVIEYISAYAYAAANADQVFALECIISGTPARLRKHSSFQRIIELRTKLHQKERSENTKKKAIPCADDLDGLRDSFSKKFQCDYFEQLERSHFEELFDNQNWLKILENTHHIYELPFDETLEELYWLRGRALHEVGEVGLLIRHVLYSVKEFPHSLKLAKLLLNVAKRIRSSILVWRFFEMDIGCEDIAYVLRQIQSCLSFIKDPNLASFIFLFGMEHAEKPEKFELNFSRKLSQSGLLYVVAKNMLTETFHPKLHYDNVDAFVSLTSRAGLRRSTLEYLSSRRSELPDDVFLKTYKKVSKNMINPQDLMNSSEN